MKRVLRIASFVLAAAVLWIAVGFFSAQRACAHDPRFACSPRDDAHPIAVTDPFKSWAFYGRLEAGQSDTYALSVARPLAVAWSLLIEQADVSNPARPSVEVRDARGVPVARLDMRRSATFYEPFARIEYLSSKSATLRLAPGEYRAIVRMSGDRPQRYVFAVGDEERFGIGEIPYVLGAIYRIDVRGH